jgi:glycopeptide antibiotics resistance protein
LKEQTKRKLTKAGWFLFYIYIILLSYFLFFSEHYGRDCINQEYRYNLQLFKEIKRFIEYREQLGVESFIVNILGNVLAFTPFGFFISALNKKYRRLFFVAFFSALFSLCVEGIQLLLRVGIFDVDDVVLNTIGGMGGYLIYLILTGLLNRSSQKSRKSGRK